MNYTQNEQVSTTTTPENYLHLPCSLDGFTNTRSTQRTAVSGKNIYHFHGSLKLDDSDRTCPKCGDMMHIHNTFSCNLWHLNFGQNYSLLEFEKKQFLCPSCRTTRVQQVPFQAQCHRITATLLQYTRDLLAIGSYTLKQVAEITGLGKNTVKAIDLKRLEDKYTINGSTLIKPEVAGKVP